MTTSTRNQMEKARQANHNPHSHRRISRRMRMRESSPVRVNRIVVGVALLATGVLSA
ncbi:hypothetical protein AB0N87_36720 [Streptomyces sp. NPDC093228]|uniref:hypothetical protein n=1 Tax=unclassified Streptomyces TaxID=2593676 RepID=UPI000E3712C4|nr:MULTISPECIES: hypothetical protein [unclassified Streptomyces]MDX3259811.1 hypothetical protein [Streptomyces sp. MI02-2A]REE65412.1 hypothetical protein BX257_8140 [Streptomyces sp. 3212.3]